MRRLQDHLQRVWQIYSATDQLEQRLDAAARDQGMFMSPSCLPQQLLLLGKRSCERRRIFCSDCLFRGEIQQGDHWQHRKDFLGVFGMSGIHPGWNIRQGWATPHLYTYQMPNKSPQSTKDGIWLVKEVNVRRCCKVCSAKHSESVLMEDRVFRGKHNCVLHIWD